MLLTVGRSYVGNDVTSLDRACARVPTKIFLNIVPTALVTRPPGPITEHELEGVPRVESTGITVACISATREQHVQLTSELSELRSDVTLREREQNRLARELADAMTQCQVRRRR